MNILKNIDNQKNIVYTVFIISKQAYQFTNETKIFQSNDFNLIGPCGVRGPCCDPGFKLFYNN